MKMFVSNNNSSNKNYTLQQTGDERINYDDPLTMYNNNDGPKCRGDYFVFAEEGVDDNKQYPSEESEDNINAKTRSLRQTVKEGQILDSHFIEIIYEHPKLAVSHLFEKS
jgi:hypothetical protein